MHLAQLETGRHVGSDSADVMDEQRTGEICSASFTVRRHVVASKTGRYVFKDAFDQPRAGS